MHCRDISSESVSMCHMSMPYEFYDALICSLWPKVLHTILERMLAWWDVEADTQRELEALDADDVTYVSGDSQMEVLEEKRQYAEDHFADHFENLLGGLQLQSEKLLRFEQSIFSSNSHTDAVVEDIQGSTSPRPDLEPLQNCGSQNCFLALQNFIRPLCSLDQEDSYGLKDAFVYAETLKTKNEDWTTKLESNERRPAKGLKQLRMGQAQIDKIGDVKSSPHTSKNRKKVQKARGVENLKDRLLHTFYLNCKSVSFHDMKLGTYLPNALSSRKKQKLIINAFLDTFKSKVIPVNGSSWDVTSTRIFKQPDINSPLTAWKECFYDTSNDSITYRADDEGVQVVSSLIPELSKLVGISMNHFVLPFQCLWVELFSQLLSIDHRCLLLAEVASDKDEGVQLPLYAKDTHLSKTNALHFHECENSEGSPPCLLAICYKDDEGLLRSEAVCKPERHDQCCKADIRFAHECERIRVSMTCTLEEAAVCRKDGGEALDLEQRKHKRKKKSCKLIIKVQAVWRGCRIRKGNILEKLREEKRLQEAAIVKTQALWRGWRIRKWNFLEKLCAEERIQEAAVVRMQAVWRGFRTRKRFRMAIESSRYDEDDDYEYAAVDDIGISVERVWFDDYATACHDNIKQIFSDPQCPLVVGGKEARSLEQGQSGGGSKVTDKEQLHYNNEDIERDISHDMKSSSDLQSDFVEHDDATNSFKEASADDNTVSCNDFLYKIEGSLGMRQQVADQTRNSAAEIARDWGFKDERTAVQFLKALENTKRRVEGPKIRNPDSQTRLRAFMARCGGHKSNDKGILGVPQLPGQGCSFHAFSTNTYKLSLLETPSGIKIVLVTDPGMGDLREALRHIYSNIYVEYVIKNPLYKPSEHFRCELFNAALDQYVKTLK
ncbi:hypothetical protein GOP47_0012228 [Adiantum capillus-veneris]|uniref:Uncharacterized protein n=1 Tax=Adiantum capillus-veneris TaxID=13818 RepID=A0A9D4UQS7_ADICA|nr:hypothetical protein GOP47_0012228 [Adiantum capillus-veneris]